MIGADQSPAIGSKSQFKPGQSGNPNGKPKGTKHLSTWIRELMEDESFEAVLADGSTYKGAPVKAVIITLINKALAGDTKAFDLLGKYGYGVKLSESVAEKELPIPIMGKTPITLVEFIGDDV